MYNKILNDKVIIDRYLEVEKYEYENKGWANHNLSHVLNVVDTVEVVLKALNYDDEFIENAKIAALLHDTGANLGKDGHPHRGYLFAKEYFEKNNISLKYEDMVLEAIDKHSMGFSTDNIIALTLIFADKIDVKKNRITEIGKTIVGNRQYQYIDDINIKIVDGKLLINFVVSSEFNLEEVEEFYFTIKIFKAIRAFSDKVFLKAFVFINDKEWEMFRKIGI